MDTILNQLIMYYSNTFYGIGIAAVIIILLYAIISFVNSNKKFTILSFAVGLVIVPFLSFQMSRLYGAIEVRNTLENVTEMASSVKETITNVAGLDEQETQEALSLASEIIPGVSDVIEAGTELSKLSDKMLEEAYSYLNWYIVRRALWSMGFLIIAIIAMCFTFEEVNASQRKRSLRYERISSRRSTENRPTRRKTRI